MKGSENVPPEVETAFKAFVESLEDEFTQDLHDGIMAVHVSVEALCVS